MSPRTSSAALLALLTACGGGGEAPRPAASWRATGSLGVARTPDHAFTLPSGKVLVAGGQVDSLAHILGGTAAVELYDSLTGGWSAAAPMSQARRIACGVLLPSGKVLVTGGNADLTAPVVASAETYDPATDGWTPTATSMVSPRMAHACVVLPSGEVLLGGGRGESAVLPGSAELYDPATGNFTPTGSMLTPRQHFMATLLGSGKVLVAGGCTDDLDCATSTAAAELYDPATGRWSATGSLPASMQSHTVTLLPGGMVLAAGGTSAYLVETPADRHAAIYDPAAGAWYPTADLPFTRMEHIALPLASGDVLLVGGDWGSSNLRRTLRYTPATGRWTEGPAALAIHGIPAAARLADRSWLVAGGVVLSGSGQVSVAEAEIFTE